MAKYSVPEKLLVLTLSNSGLYALGGGESGRIYLWEVTHKKFFMLYNLSFKCFDHPNPKIATGALLATIDAHFKPISSLHFSADDHAFVSAAQDSFAHVWILSRLV